MTPSEQRILDKAKAILASRVNDTDVFSSPEPVRRYCQLQLAGECDEHFCCLFLTSKHHLIAFERLFCGTIDSSVVYPRVVVRRCLELNAAAVIFVHNHPSGVAEPSTADRRITERLQQALQLVDIRVLDHLIVTGGDITSFAEEGLL